MAENKSPQSRSSEDCLPHIERLEKQIYQRMTAVEEDAKKLRKRTHDIAGEVTAIKGKVEFIEQDIKMQDEVLQRQGKTADQTNEMVSEINKAILGEHNSAKPGMAEQLRTLNGKEATRSKAFWIFITALATPTAGLLMYLLYFAYSHMHK